LVVQDDQGQNEERTPQKESFEHYPMISQELRDQGGQFAVVLDNPT
jgi:hypothetical protein